MRSLIDATGIATTRYLMVVYLYRTRPLTGLYEMAYVKTEQGVNGTLNEHENTNIS